MYSQDMTLVVDNSVHSEVVMPQEVQAQAAVAVEAYHKGADPSAAADSPGDFECSVAAKQEYSVAAQQDPLCSVGAVPLVEHLRMAWRRSQAEPRTH
jgi:hypothetical protein